MPVSLLHHKLNKLNSLHLQNVRAALAKIAHYQEVLDSYGINNELIQDFGGVQFVYEDVNHLLNKHSPKE